MVEVEDPTNGERIAKRLARAGISSRRDAEALIADGRIRVNGVVLDSPARNVTANDRIELDGNPIPEIERTRLFLFHKPGGVVTTNKDPEGRRTVFDVLPKDLPRLLTVGRLDINTEGLLLLTNDGGLARVLELPATGWLRRYRVRVHGTVDEAKLAELKNGIAVDGVFYGSIEAALDRQQGSNAWLTIGLREGKNREVKNVLGALGLDVTRLIRISYGPFQLGELPEGTVSELKGRYLRDQLGERLMAESGAVFDLPDRAAPAPARAEEPQRERRSEGTPNRKREREDHRTDMLDRLQTKPQGRFGDKPRSFGDKPDRFGDKPAGRFGDKPGGFKSGGAGPRGKREEERAPPPPRRNANVWMAPGARPRSDKKVEAEAAERAARDEARAPRSRPSSDRPYRSDASSEGRSFKPRESGPRENREEGGAKPYRARPTEGRPFVKRDRPEGGFGAPRGDREEGAAKPYRARSSEGQSYVKRDRPETRSEDRAPRPAGDKPFAKKPFGDKRPFNKDRPSGGDRPETRSFKPRSEAGPRAGGESRGNDGPKRGGPGGGPRSGGRNADRRR
ncbi:pseudouridine synthase [Tianweitania populi]|uniref:Pseudouridine synthase n=2 Tax=Tianweitania populi TaxID=1607949 RepID=A0A8J3DRB0_9HYPH|nr:pseudouridine synthase [Tianweitania populi]